MNIAITLKRSQLDASIEALQQQNIQKPDLIAEKCMYFIYTNALKKLLKKQIDKSDEYSSKPFRMVLKYEEATALLMELDRVKFTNNRYTENAVRTLKAVLHQKLSA